MANILVTGALGQVGRELQFWANQYPQHRFTFTDVAELDITDAGAVALFFGENDFDFCLNCAAYTAVDKAENDVELATKINVKGVQHLAKAGAQHQAFLVHLSTDYVYHNQQNTPFKEGDPTNPQGVYAATKLAGDRAALEVHPATMIVRTSWVYSSFGHNFVKTMLRLGRERDQFNVVFDQIGTPTYARDLAKALLEAVGKIESGAVSRKEASGVFHFSNEGVSSWYDFAKAIFQISNTTCTVHPIETANYPTPAKRPPFSVLNKGKIKQTFGLEIPHWHEALERCLMALGNAKDES